MGDERGTSAVPWKSLWNLQSPIRSSQAPSLRALKYLSSCLLSQCEECNQMQMFNSHSHIHCSWQQHARYLFLGYSTTNARAHTHTHTRCIWPRSNVIRDNNCLFFLPESHPTFHLCSNNTTQVPITKQTSIFVTFVSTDVPHPRATVVRETEDTWRQIRQRLANRNRTFVPVLCYHKTHHLHKELKLKQTHFSTQK